MAPEGQHRGGGWHCDAHVLYPPRADQDGGVGTDGRPDHTRHAGKENDKRSFQQSLPPPSSFHHPSSILLRPGCWQKLLPQPQPLTSGFSSPPQLALGATEATPSGRASHRTQAKTTDLKKALDGLK
ncbi:hypothetical protein C0Q70_11788 [Pomacea canaliculata]|uniref:Uncharacterized protein n=1 Tax=Pomacea canaliculata TaxID=400727 RepID=A0A2T7P709_POMCA|nr:hypothetical protein C0Q70_11788 [Pomacea canaliculata]